MGDAITVVLIGGLVVVFIFVWVVSRMLKAAANKQIGIGRTALEEDRLADALAAFKEAVLVGFGFSVFYDAVDGMSAVYAKAGKDVDLESIRQFRRDVDALQKDKRYWNKSAYTKEGEAVLEAIKEKLNEAITSLPDV